MIFRSLCRNAEIGANSYFLDAGTAKIVLDSGMHPEHEGAEALPRFELLGDDEMDAAVVTHAHLDHVGTLPVLMRHHSRAKVFLSPATADLAAAMLHNSVTVMQAKRVELGITEYPLFDHREIDDLTDHFEIRALERPFDLDAEGTVRATFHDAGHILGAVGVTLEANGKRIFYTGDVNFEDQSLLKGARFPTDPVDALIVETTRGASPRQPAYTREAEERALAEGIERTLQRRGSVLMPVFAIGKTQEVLTMIHHFKAKRWIPRDTPVYIGGLSTKMTMLYDRHADTTRRTLPGFRIFEEMDLQAGNRKRRGPIPLHPGCIYALSSGMMTEKTVSNQFARLGFLENRKNSLFFVGYADPASPGGRLRHAVPGDKVVLDPKEPAVELRCEMRIFDFSGHATRDTLLDYILRLNPRITFLVHGDLPAAQWFQEQLAAKAPGMKTIIPEPGVDYQV